MSDDDVPDLIDIPTQQHIPPCLPTFNRIYYQTATLSDSTTGPAAPLYILEHEPEEPWDSFSPNPSQRSDPAAPVQVIFTRRWSQGLKDGEEESSTFTPKGPPRWLGMEIRTKDGYSLSVRRITLIFHIYCKLTTRRHMPDKLSDNFQGGCFDTIQHISRLLAHAQHNFDLLPPNLEPKGGPEQHSGGNEILLRGFHSSSAAVASVPQASLHHGPGRW